MALPKYKLSRASTRARKAQWKAKVPKFSIAECPQCHQPKLSHHGCMKCGYYAGKNFIAVKTET